MADNFVYDNLPLPETKSDRGDLPDGVPTSQAIRALDFNRVSRYLGDLRDVVGAIAVDPSSAAPVLATGTTTARALATRFAEVFNVKDFGAKGDGTTDDTTAIQAAATAAGSSTNATLYFPGATSYRTTSTVTVPPGVNVRMEAPIVFAGTGNVSALVVGTSGVTNLRRSLTLQVQRSTISDWSDEACVGVTLYNPNTCDIDIVDARSFTVGVAFVGAGAGAVYNNVRLRNIQDNKVGLLLDATTVATVDGWCNENDFMGGRFWCATTTNVALRCYGIRIDSHANGYVNNSNVFFKPSLELGESSPGVKRPGTGIQLVQARMTRVIEARIERTEIGVETLNDAHDNTISISYEDVTTRHLDSGTSAGNIVVGARERHFERCGRPIFSTNDLVNECCAYNATNLFVRRTSFGASSQAGRLKSTDLIVVGADYLEFPSTRGIGVTVDTRVAKEFVLARDVVTGFGGRVVVRCYDSGGAVLDGSSTAYVRGTSGSALAWFASYGGVFRTGTDSTGPVYFKVSSAVSSIWVGVVGGTAVAQVRGFTIFTEPDGVQPTVTAGYSGRTEDRFIATQAPAFGTWPRGMTVWAESPSAASNPGWECVTAGTPGTWRPFAALLTYLTATTTWDAPSVATGASTSTTVTVTGAALGDDARAILSVAVPAGAILSANVTATDTVTVTLVNMTGSALDLASATLRADVYKH